MKCDSCGKDRDCPYVILGLFLCEDCKKTYEVEKGKVIE